MKKLLMILASVGARRSFWEIKGQTREIFLIAFLQLIVHLHSRKPDNFLPIISSSLSPLHIVNVGFIFVIRLSFEIVITPSTKELKSASRYSFCPWISLWYSLILFSLSWRDSIILLILVPNCAILLLALLLTLFDKPFIVRWEF